MANGRRGGGFGDRNRDGIDDEIDRRPGNSGTSPEYARLYDRRTEQEFSNRLETANQIEQARILAEYQSEQEQARDALTDAQKQVHFFPSVGKFIIPEENTWAAHVALVRDNSTHLFFHPDKYLYFDRIIAQELGNPALYDPEHPDYRKYEGLRTNLEVLRNDIIGYYLNDGAFNPGDEIHIPKIEGIARAVAQGLKNDVWWKRPFTRSISADVANVEGVGAREIYKFLLSGQDAPESDTPFNRILHRSLKLPLHNWNLPPLEQTPFSDAALSAAPPRPNKAPSISAERARERSLAADHEAHLANRSERAVSIAKRLRTPESLDVPTQEQSIDEARTILRWLKNLSLAERPLEEWLAQGTPAEQSEKVEAVSRLVELYGGQVKIAAAHSPATTHELVMQSAHDAAGALALGISDHTLDNLPDNHPRIATLEDALAGTPQAWDDRQNHSVSELLSTLETGLEWASGKNVSDVSPAERLLEMSRRIHMSAKKLRSIDTLGEPARIESIELAREILRKLKGLGFADKPVETLINQPGNAAEKAALAQQIGQMADSYHALLAEAAQTNPDLMKDARVIEANQAVGQFAHAVSLMAAKEIPTSLAAAQQIAADVTQMPEEWKGLAGRTVGRLMQSMEGGLEKAVGELQAQQQEQQQDEELARQIIEANAQSHGLHRRKRRRRSSGSSRTPALTKSAKRRNAGDLNGDGVADRLQGLNLSSQDLIAIRQLGGNLKNMGDQAANLAPMDVSSVNPLAPDDRNFVAKTRPEKDQPRPGAKNNRPQI